MPNAVFDLQPGDIVTREQLAAAYGGAPHNGGGIVASNQSSLVYVFADPAKSSQFGYTFDGFSADGSVFHYTGAGPTGDQELTKANSSIASHAEKGRTLHVFHAVGPAKSSGPRPQQYLGEFILDPSHPYDRVPAREGSRDVVRTVIVFRLLPVDAVPAHIVNDVKTSQIDALPTALLVPAEVHSTHFFESSAQESRMNIRRESSLVTDFQNSQPERQFERWAIPIPHSSGTLLTDVYDVTDRVLYEAKASAGRNNMRLAVGQLLDYERHIAPRVEDLRCRLLLPERPSADLRDYLEHVGFGAVYRAEGQFHYDLAS